MSNPNPASDTTFDVIIVGGRPAGATLAARLGQQGVRVLLVDRSTFPSLPAVSSPVIYPCTMSLLDEIGAKESAYARNTPPLRTLVNEARDQYRAITRLPENNGRDYAYAVDRQRFDHALWQHAAAQPNVTALAGFSVTDLLWQDAQVVGIVGKPSGGQATSYHAEMVVGADGRWSTVARKVDAPFYNEVVEEQTTSLYYAYWRNLAPYDLDGPMVLAAGTQDGVGYLLLDSADGTTGIVVEGYTDRLAEFAHTPGDVDAMYLAMLQNAPRIWARLQHAERVSSVRGLKHTPNYYRQLAGPGWALVGDAAHHKDPLGGQGIYDAIYSSRALSQAYLRYKRGEADWQTAMAGYKTDFEAETLPVYHSTLASRANLNAPNWFARLLGRYASENPAFMRSVIRVPMRIAKAEEAINSTLIGTTFAKGIANDTRRFFTGALSESAIPPLPSQLAEGAQPLRGNMGCLGWMIALPAMMMVGAVSPLLRGPKS
jgi:2-polyprenyl-6-methoxyphenol hydroxylase-like FAD-dependent oxidoreductase